MNGKPTAAAGKIDVGGDLTVNRLGYGAMRITGPGTWGDPLEKNVTAASIELTDEEIRAITLAALSQ